MGNGDLWGVSEGEEWWLLNWIGFTIFLLFILKNWEKYKAKCDSPNCVRCNGLLNVPDLQKRLQKYLAVGNGENVCRVEELLINGLNHHSVYNNVIKESGYGKWTEVAKHPSQVWILPGLTRQTFWLARMNSIHSKLKNIIITSEGTEFVNNVRMELMEAKNSENGWTTNSTPSGKWRIFSLYNQGTANKNNCAVCPKTAHFLTTIELFMCDHIYGNAFFSILQPGSHILPHAGPCNYRLRCHLPLTVPPGFKIKVGREVAIWEESKLMIFDDSFIHEVWSDDTNQEEARAVLIFDIWHPEVTSAEKRAIHYIFD